MGYSGQGKACPEKGRKGEKKTSERNLIDLFDELFAQCGGAFKQSRSASRGRDLAYGILNCMGRGTLTGILTASGRQFLDWSQAYRLFTQDRMNQEVFFSVIRKTLLDNHLAADTPIFGHLDDTILKKTGKKVHGTAWRRDPLGPPFQTNFIWGQRFLQLSVSLPEGPGPSAARAIPVDFRHCPTVTRPKKTDGPEAWENYKAQQKLAKISKKGAEGIRALRENLDREGAADRRLIMSVDGGYTNETVFKGLPERVTLIGRTRKDCRLHALPDKNKKPGRKRVYGDELPTPEEIRQSEEYPWEKVRAFAAGKVHNFSVKVVKNVRWRKAGEQNLQLVIIRPLAYRLTANSKLLYRKPAYLLCTDPDLDIETLLQAYVWRWGIEVNFREEKSIMGCGKAQVRNPNAVEKVPAFIVAIYGLLHLAEETMARNQNNLELPASKWYPKKRKKRVSTGDILNKVKAQMWARAINIDFSHFVNIQARMQKGRIAVEPVLSAVCYTRK